MGTQTFNDQLGNALREGLQKRANETGEEYTLHQRGKHKETFTAQDKSAKKDTLPGFAPRIERPFDSDFETQQVEYLVSDTMRDLGTWLIENKRALNHLESVSIAYLWKAKGGKSGGKMVLGKCSKTPTMVQTYRHTTFTIWLAHDHCKELNLTDDQLEALLYHELCHAVIEEVENENTGDVSFRPAILAHDLEMFHSEVEEYGLWTAELVQAKAVFQQELPGFRDPVMQEASV